MGFNKMIAIRKLDREKYEILQDGKVVKTCYSTWSAVKEYNELRAKQEKNGCYDAIRQTRV